MNRTLKLFLALVSLCMTVFCFAQKSELRFNKDGKFKIVQFTDVHFKYKNPASDIALERINQVLEEACAPKLNTGMFAAMKESGDVMGIFVGHDHDNDYAVMWKGILLAYGRFTGGNTEYNHLPNGARIIVLDEGARTFTSWIRQKDGIVDKVTYPASFVKDDWTKR